MSSCVVASILKELNSLDPESLNRLQWHCHEFSPVKFSDVVGRALKTLRQSLITEWLDQLAGHWNFSSSE
jgi:hypothetical protein